MADIRKLHPRPTITAPRPKPPTPAKAPAPRPLATASVGVDRRTGRTSGFEAFRPARVQLEHRHDEHHHPERDHDATSTGRRTAGGTPDDSIGRRGVGGTPDDSIGRRGAGGTPDDSIGGDEALERGVGSKSVGVTRGRLVPDSARAGLSDETVKKMDALLARGPVKRTNASYVMGDPAFSKMSVEDRTKLVDLMTVGGPRSARAVAELFEKGRSGRLTEAAPDGTRTVDSLLRIAHSDAKRNLAPVLFDIARPGRIWQGTAPTCTVSTMQYELARKEPAEYARVMAGLIVDGHVTMRGGGVLRAEANAVSAAHDNRDLRSRSEAIFQTAAMEYANGLDDYKPELQQSDRLFFGKEYQGLYPNQIRNMVGQLFGVSYKTREIGTDAQARDELNRILGRERPNRPVIFDISMGKNSNHLVALEGIEGNRVLFRDPSTGDVRSMSKEKFIKDLVAVHYADEPAPAGFVSQFAVAKYGLGQVAGVVRDAASSVANVIGKWF